MGERVPATPDFTTIQHAAQAAATSIVEAMIPALGQIRVAMEAMARAQAESIRRAQQTFLPYRRASIGGNGSDAWDPLWQSAVCSAWLHEPCPDIDGSLQCTCTCHH